MVLCGCPTLAVLGVNRAFSPAQTGELGLPIATVTILTLWPFSVLVIVPLVPTAAPLAVSSAMY